MSNIVSPRVQRAFIGRFGGKLRPIQAIAFRDLTPDTDGLVMSQTGSGKTEAVLAPVAQSILDFRVNHKPSLRALIISPTRALATDLYNRCVDCFANLNLRLDVATSDKRTVGQLPSDVLIRTPEGIEGALHKNPSQFAEVKEIVIDELHVFMASARGTQLVGQLLRLNDLFGEHRRVGMSATIDDVSAVDRSGLLRSPLIVHDRADTGVIEWIFYDWIEGDPTAASRLVRLLRDKNVRKAIGFAKSKADVEKYAHALGDGYLKGKTFPHHSNLSSSERKRIEDAFRKMPVGLVVATTTLEVGIDIGSIDTCVLFDPPPSYSSFRQRIGRAGRRSGTRKVVCVCNRKHRRIEYTAVTRAPDVRIADVRPFLSGYLQQILVFVLVQDGAVIGQIQDFSYRAFGIAPSRTGVILDYLVSDGYLRRDSDSVYPTDIVWEMARSRELFRTFAGNSGAHMFEESTGKYLGQASVGGSPNVLLGGKARQVKGMQPGSGVIVAATGGDGVPSFASGAKSSVQVLASKYACRLGKAFRTAE